MVGVLRRPGLSKAGMAVPGTPSIKLLVVKFAPVSNRAPPGARGEAPSTCSAPRRPRRAPSLDLRPSGGLAPRGREYGRLKPGGARLFPPRGPLAAGARPIGLRAGTPARAGLRPAWIPGEACPRVQRFSSLGGVGGAPAPPGSTPARGPVPAQQRSAPPARGRERAPVQTVRRCARAKALARSHASPSLTARASRRLRSRRRLRWSPLATPARCPVLRPRPGHSGI